MKKIGLLGGLSWVSTHEYYALINQHVREAFKDNTSAHIVIESVNEHLFLDRLTSDPTEQICSKMVADAVNVLEVAQAEVIALSANGIHRFIKDLPEYSRQRIVHIATETAKACDHLGYKKVGLLGVYQTMTGDFYKKALADFGINVMVPNEAHMQDIHQRIVDDLCLGDFNDNNKAYFLDHSRRLVDEGADAVILGCTEIPLLLKDELNTHSQLISTTHVHTKAIVEKALSRE
ncbi:amino acid racemase [Psychrobacter sp. B38]|uniref:aspartate/glutamate racemase family protein n=1 Tax=Psychrobacter sp. B38 TaxID=3143538 RepID=UPI00320CDB83